MPRVLHTVGYGNTQPSEFLRKLWNNQINWIIDVRRERSKSWCKKYWAGEEMSVFLAESELADPIGYEHAWEFGNHYDTLEGYKEWLTTNGDVRAVLKTLAALLRGSKPEFGWCLLCSEAKPFDSAGGLVACHRVYVANALVEMLDDGWKVRHL